MRPATSSGRKIADAAIVARPALLKSVILEGDGTNACNVIIYDNATTAAGNVLAKILIPASSVQCFVWQSSDGVEANNGLYADVTGTGAAYIVHYSDL